MNFHIGITLLLYTTLNGTIVVNLCNNQNLYTHFCRWYNYIIISNFFVLLHAHINSYAHTCSGKITWQKNCTLWVFHRFFNGLCNPAATSQCFDNHRDTWDRNHSSNRQCELVQDIGCCKCWQTFSGCVVETKILQEFTDINTTVGKQNTNVKTKFKNPNFNMKILYDLLAMNIPMCTYT